MKNAVEHVFGWPDMLVKIILLFLFISNNAFAEKQQQLYIMLNVDNTIVDRVQDCSPKLITKLEKQNIDVQKLNFVTNHQNSPKFISIYKKLSERKELINESKYMSKIEVQEIANNEFSITECIAIRPAIKGLLEQLLQLKIPVTILLTSRNDTTRTVNLQKNLNLKIDGKNFFQMTTVVPRDYFRIKLKEISLKSAVELRKNLKYIKPDDFVILLDHISDNRFVKSDPKRDLNIFVSKFSIDQTYDYNKDKTEMQAIIKQINQFIGQSYESPFNQ